MRINLLLLILILTSCSNFRISNDRPEEIHLNGYKEFDKGDYIEQLKSLEEVFAQRNRKSLIKISKKSKKYLDSIVKNITMNNELFFKQNVEANYYVIDSKTPFHFSLPGRRFFISSTLLDRYVKNESMLYCFLVYELIRSEKNIYQKKIILPTKTMDENRILSLLRLNTPDKVEIHKWAFYLLKRVGIDTDSYLSWLQIKNRNSIDFVLQLGDIQSISREEAMFKAFLIETAKKNSSNRYRGSSKGFYAFINDVKR